MGRISSQRHENGSIFTEGTRAPGCLWEVWDMPDTPISKLPRRCTCLFGDCPRREALWQSCRSIVTSTKDTSLRVLLDHHKARCRRIGQEMWQMLEICKSLASSTSLPIADEQSIAIFYMGNGFDWSSFDTPWRTQVCHSGRWLLHQVDESQRACVDLQLKGTIFYMG